MEGLFVYWALGWEDYYPSGGLENVLAVFRTRAEADALIEEERNRKPRPLYDNFEVVDVSDILKTGVLPGTSED